MTEWAEKTSLSCLQSYGTLHESRCTEPRNGPKYLPWGESALVWQYKHHPSGQRPGSLLCHNSCPQQPPAFVQLRKGFSITASIVVDKANLDEVGIRLVVESKIILGGSRRFFLLYKRIPNHNLHSVGDTICLKGGLL